MRYHIIAPVCGALLVLSGCGNQFQYNPQWKSWLTNINAQWEVNQDHIVLDSHTSFEWTIYAATRSRQPNFTYWTTKSSWKRLSSDQAKRQLGQEWMLVPPGHYYFYQLSVPGTAWVSYPATMVGAATTMQNSQDNKRLVKDIIYGPPDSPPIFLATAPLQLTAIATNQSEQSITYTWMPLAKSTS